MGAPTRGGLLFYIGCPRKASVRRWHLSRDLKEVRHERVALRGRRILDKGNSNRRRDTDKWACSVYSPDSKETHAPRRSQAGVVRHGSRKGVDPDRMGLGTTGKTLSFTLNEMLGHWRWLSRAAWSDFLTEGLAKPWRWRKERSTGVSPSVNNSSLRPKEFIASSAHPVLEELLALSPQASRLGTGWGQPCCPNRVIPIGSLPGREKILPNIRNT